MSDEGDDARSPFGGRRLYLCITDKAKADPLKEQARGVDARVKARLPAWTSWKWSNKGGLLRASARPFQPSLRRGNHKHTYT